MVPGSSAKSRARPPRESISRARTTQVSPSPTHTASQYGTTGRGQHNDGINIAVPKGTPVHAADDGVVAYAGNELRGFGNLLIIDHGNGYMSLYGNNESLFKQVGDVLHGGDSIASVGNSGGNEESGLYFELRHEGNPFDPMKWIAR